MSVLFIMLKILLENRCTFPMALEELLISSAMTTGSSFLGTVIFWIWFCPNHRCCQLKAIRKVVERTEE